MPDVTSGKRTRVCHHRHLLLCRALLSLVVAFGSSYMRGKFSQPRIFCYTYREIVPGTCTVAPVLATLFLFSPNIILFHLEPLFSTFSFNHILIICVPSRTLVLIYEDAIYGVPLPLEPRWNRIKNALPLLSKFGKIKTLGHSCSKAG